MRIQSNGECMAGLGAASWLDEYRLGPTGVSFNTAWYLAKLSPDVPVPHFTAAGDDAISDRMLRQIAGSGIDTGHIGTIAGKSFGPDRIALDTGARSLSCWRGQSRREGAQYDA